MRCRWNYVALLVLLLLIICAAIQLPRLSFDNNLLSLFPNSDEYQGQAIADEQRADSVTGKVMLLLGTDHITVTREAATTVASTLLQCDCFARLVTHADTSSYSNLMQLYQQYLPNLLTPADSDRLANNPAEAVQKGLQSLTTHPGPGTARALQQDPLGTLTAYRQWLFAPYGSAAKLDESGFLSVTIEGKRYLLLELELDGSPYSITVQESARRALDTVLTSFMAQPGAQVLKTGALFYATAGSDQARAEISTVGIGSILGICCVLVLVFRSVGILVLGFLPIVAGVAVGAALTQWFFGSIHVMALVFGASLIGVSIDYSMHCFSRRAFKGTEWESRTGMGALLPPLTLSVLTSSLAYMSFTLAELPGFIQIAVFSAVGLVTAYLTVVALYPYALSGSPRRPLPRPIVSGMTQWCHYHERIRDFPAWGWGLAGVAALAVMGSASFNDDIRQMQEPDSILKQQEAQFREALGANISLPYVLVSAEQRPLLLERIEHLSSDLDQAIADGEISGYQSIARFIPSPQKQAHNRAQWHKLVASDELNPIVELLRPPFQQPLMDRLISDTPLPWEQAWAEVKRLANSPIYFEHDGRHYGVVALFGLGTDQGLAERMRALPDVDWVDPVARTNHLLESYRLTAVKLLLSAYVVVLLSLAWRYGFRGALSCLIPPALASLLSLAAQSAMGYSISIFHIMALLLVLGIGIDYALFMRESGGKSKDTYLAIGISMLTTVLSFGLLSFSNTAAIAAFGLTVMIGITLSFLLAPVAIPNTDLLSD